MLPQVTLTGDEGVMPFWVYENTIHKFARIHKATCSFCSSGRGLHGGGKRGSGTWHGPFAGIDSAVAAAFHTKQPDVRGCDLCTGTIARTGAAATAADCAPGRITTPVIGAQLGVVSWDEERELRCSMSFLWVPQGRAFLDHAGRITFPPAEAEAGLYRLAARHPDGRNANYIGESDNLRRRFRNYRTPGPSQQTSLRINRWLKDLLGDGGEVSISIAKQVCLNGASADLSSKPTRRMFESMAIVFGHAENIESLNR